jgi:quinol monooxygenase YgiN
MAALLSLVGPVRSQPGCTATRVLHEMDEDEAVTIEAEWHTQPDLERHFRTPAFRTLLATMELASRCPDFEVDMVDGRRGFELVEAVLGDGQGDTAGRPRHAAPGT